MPTAKLASRGLRSPLGMVLLPCLLLLCVSVPHLDQGDFRRDTGRYAAVGLHMWTDGSLWVPYLDPETPYFNKPPLAIWLHGFVLKCFGPHLAAARAPSVLAALGVVGLSVLTVRRLGSRSEAVVSGMVLALTYEFFRRTREISLDLWQLFFVMLAVYWVVCGMGSGRGWKVALAGVPLGLALLCKPFVALGTLPILAAWCFLRGQGRLAAWLGLGALPVALLTALPWHWHLYALFGQRFVDQYLFHEVVDRAKGIRDVAPFYYYVLENLGTYWPWMVGLAFALYVRCLSQRPHRRSSRDLVLLGGIWVVGVGTMISAFPDKAPNYALPLYPMLSWVVASGLCRVGWPPLRRWYARGFPWLAPATIVLLLALSLAPIQFQKRDPDWKALLDWMARHSVSPRQLRYAGLPPNDICYYYLRTGLWLPRRVTEGHPTPAGLEEQFVLVNSRARTADQPEFKAAFRAGRLTLVRETDLPESP